MQNNKTDDLIKLYLKAKKTYYSGNPIMSDEEFDGLENLLKSLNVDVVNVVGTPTRTNNKVQALFDIEGTKDTKGKHLTKLLSLEKIKTGAGGLPPTDDALRWFKSLNTSHVVVELKYDGNAVNLIYKDGNFLKALTRGDGVEGMDITNKIKGMIPGNIPQTINIKSSYVEIRGEVIISVPIFDSKYNQFKNPRNFIAGTLHRDDTDLSVLKDLSFIPFDVRTYTPKMEHNDITVLEGSGFELPYTVDIVANATNFAGKFNNIYDELFQYRKTCKFQLDGFVMKTESSIREPLGEGSHHPNWALAVKFESPKVITSINGIEWKIGKTGEMFPTGTLEPVDLDGATISRVSMHNYGWIIDNKCYPGSIVEVAKHGDIIPGIIKVVSNSTSNKYQFPTDCPYCNEELDIEDMHLMCNNTRCNGKLFYQFIYGVNSLNLDFFGESTLEKIFYNTPVKTAFDLFDGQKFNRMNLVRNSIFPDGKNVERILEQVDNKQTLTVQQTLLMLGIPGLGKRVSEELAKKVSGIKYTTFGLEKRFFDMFDSDGEYYTELLEGMKLLESNGIKIEMPKNDTDVKTVEFTGEPPEEFANKEEFANHIFKYGYKHTSLKRTTSYLLTNDYNSNTGKMKKANEYGIKILTYDDFLKLL